MPVRSGTGGRRPTAIEERIRDAAVLLTSRISLVETGRAFLRARLSARLPEDRWADAERELDALWFRTEVWEVTPAIWEAAARIAPRASLRTLDAIHLATFTAARRRIGELQLLTADERLRSAVSSVS